jgi:putative Mg2+ transporter-C (MgtC) family protein
MGQTVSSALFGTAMPTELTGLDLIVRLLCTLIAGGIIGYNRGEHGKAAGLRTTLLVCMAASVAMLQMNYLLTLSGRSSDSFVMNDLMRLPLGILTGVGFIGGGAILRRGNLVVGVTTAATLWYVTVVGLCFGGGQLLLGWAATALGCLILWLMKWLESLLATAQRGRLTVTVEPGGPGEDDIRKALAAGGLETRDVSLAVEGGRRTYGLVTQEFCTPDNAAIPAAVEKLGRAAGVSAIEWHHFD